MTKFLFVLFTFLFICVENKKKKRKDAKQGIKDDKRPTKIKPELWCDSCQAIIKEATKTLMGKKKESDVIDYMEEVCDPKKYYSYHHSPPEMKTGCEAFISVWDEEIEKVLTNRKDDIYPINELCTVITKVLS
jgi:hypothetical protein